MLYLLLGAEFIAAAQVIVYAGAIMVLFVFVIMLLNAGEEERTTGSQVASLLGVPGLLVGLLCCAGVAADLIATAIGTVAAGASAPAAAARTTIAPAAVPRLPAAV